MSKVTVKEFLDKITTLLDGNDPENVNIMFSGSQDVMPKLTLTVTITENKTNRVLSVAPVPHSSSVYDR